jgi:surface antigen
LFRVYGQLGLSAIGVAFKAVRTVALGAGVIAPLAACSITLPFQPESRAPLKDDADITGSIPMRKDSLLDTKPGQVSPLSAKLDEEDWRRGKAAMATALDPQGNGHQVRWDNADSGARGSFAAVGDPFLQKDDICRTFVAMVSVKEPDAWFQGTACRATPSEWHIRELKAWKKPG